MSKPLIIANKFRIVSYLHYTKYVSLNKLMSYNEYQLAKIIIECNGEEDLVQNYHLFSTKTKKKMVDMASGRGCINILKWLYYNEDAIFEYTDYAVECASANGHIHILNWWKKHSDRLKMKYNLDCILIEAEYAGRRDVYEWWIDYYMN